jgi:hypothetical protein
MAEHVVAVVVPRSAQSGLSVAVRGHTVTVTGAGGYRHEIALSPDADAEHLDAQLYRDFLELRAPHLPGQ